MSSPVPGVMTRGLTGPEAVAWDPRGYLYAGGQDGRLHRLDIESGELVTVADLGGRLLGVLVGSAGAVLVCNQDLGCVQLIDPLAGRVSVVTAGTTEMPMTTPNSLAAAPDGTLYVSDSGTWGTADGRLYSWHPETGTRLLRSSSRLYPNGVAIDREGRYLYLVESELPGVVRYELSGFASDEDTREVFWRASPESIPDGVTVCADASLLVTFYEPNLVVRLIDRQPHDYASDPEGGLLNHPSNAAFFGRQLTRLCVANLGGDHLAELPTELRGATVRSPAAARPL